MSDKNVSLANKRKIDHILNVLGRGLFCIRGILRELKQSTTTTPTRMSSNKRFNEQSNDCVYFFAVLFKTRTRNT